jgi:hypothetical protein
LTGSDRIRADARLFWFDAFSFRELGRGAFEKSLLFAHLKTARFCRAVFHFKNQNGLFAAAEAP